MFYPPDSSLPIDRTAQPTPRPDVPAGMLDDPGHLRQWLARRLQRALSLERWGEGLRRGLARLEPPLGPALLDGAEASRRRRESLQELLRQLDVPPYTSLGLASPIGRVAGSLLARLSSRGARAAGGRLVEHTLSEYTALAALVEDSGGLPQVGIEAVKRLLESASREARTWERLCSAQGVA